MLKRVKEMAENKACAGTARQALKDPSTGRDSFSFIEE
jgi:hypothetical protein